MFLCFEGVSLRGVILSHSSTLLLWALRPRILKVALVAQLNTSIVLRTLLDGLFCVLLDAIPILLVPDH